MDSPHKLARCRATVAADEACSNVHERKDTNAREKRMEIAPVVPVWLTWIAASGAGIFAVAALAQALDAIFDLDRS
jgi:hypothetical protein